MAMQLFENCNSTKKYRQNSNSNSNTNNNTMNNPMSPRSQAAVRSFLLLHDDCASLQQQEELQQEQRGGIRQLLDIIMKDYILIPRSSIPPPAATDTHKKMNVPAKTLSSCGGSKVTKSKTPVPLLSGISPFSLLPQKGQKDRQHEEKANKRSLLCAHHGHYAASPTTTANKKRRIGAGGNVTTPPATDALSSSVWKTFPRLTAKAVELVSASSKSSSRDSLKHQLRTNELQWTEEMTVLAMLGRSLLTSSGASTTTTTPAASKPAKALVNTSPPPPARSAFYAQAAAAGPATALLQGALADYFKLFSTFVAPSPAAAAPVAALLGAGTMTTTKEAGDALLGKLFSSTTKHQSTTTAPIGQCAGGRRVHQHQPGDREIMELLRVAAYRSPTNTGSSSTSSSSSRHCSL